MAFSLHQGGGSHVKSDYARTIIQHTPLSPYTRQLCLDANGIWVNIPYCLIFFFVSLAAATNTRIVQEVPLVYLFRSQLNEF